MEAEQPVHNYYKDETESDNETELLAAENTAGLQAPAENNSEVTTARDIDAIHRILYG